MSKKASRATRGNKAAISLPLTLLTSAPTSLLALVSLSDGLQPGRLNKPFPPQAVFETEWYPQQQNIKLVHGEQKEEVSVPHCSEASGMEVETHQTSIPHP